jgi:hypothetical protein
LLDDLKSETLLIPNEEKEYVLFLTILKEIEKILSDPIQNKNITIKYDFIIDEKIFVKADLFKKLSVFSGFIDDSSKVSPKILT